MGQTVRLSSRRLGVTHVEVDGERFPLGDDLALGEDGISDEVLERIKSIPGVTVRNLGDDTDNDQAGEDSNEGGDASGENASAETTA